MRTATRLFLTVLLLFALPFSAIAAQQTILSTGTTWGTQAGRIQSNFNELYGRPVLPTSCSNTNTSQFNSSTGLWDCVAWDTLAADDITLYIENGIMSVKANVFQAADADLTTAAGAGAAGNSKYFGTNGTGTVGFYDLPSSGATSISGISDWPSGVSATEVGYLDGVTSGIQSQINALTTGSVPSVSSDPSVPAVGYAWYNSTDHTLNVAQATGSTKFSGTYTAWDTTPSAFSFTDETDIAINTAKDSNAITVAGINYTTPVSVTGSTGYGYKKNGSACTTSSGTVVSGDTIAACVTSSGSNSTATTATVDIGGVTDTYSVTTVASSSTTIASQLVENSTVSLTLYTWGTSFTVGSTTQSTITGKIKLQSAGTTCTARLGTGYDMSSSYITSATFTPSTGWNSFQLSSGALSPGTYWMAVLCDSGAAYRSDTDVYAGGNYRYGDPKTFNLNNVGTRDWTFEVVTP
jgi:hypothetical protein